MFFKSKLSIEILLFSVSISGHLFSIGNCRGMCDLSPRDGLNANVPEV
jgi:hypothetical protein